MTRPVTTIPTSDWTQGRKCRLTNQTSERLTDHLAVKCFGLSYSLYLECVDKYEYQ